MDIQPSVNGNQKLFQMMQGTAETEQSDNIFTKPQVASDFSDKVSLSYQAEKMKDISKEFFSGTIHSSQIPELTRKMYEAGFINAAEYKKLGGADFNISAVSESTSSVNNWIMEAVKEGDDFTAKQLVKVADALANINLSSTAELRRAEAQAYDIMTEYSKQEAESGAPQEKLDAIKKVLDVFSALADIRNKENNSSNNALSSYEKVQEAFDELTKSQA